MSEGLHPLKLWLSREGRKVLWLAHELGVHPTLLPQWMAGLRPIPADQAQRIADLTHGAVPVDAWGSR